MAAVATDEDIQKTVDDCLNLQKMIDISTNKLHGLRQCHATTPSTQAMQAIRESENKLVQMFSKQIISKARLRLKEYPPKLAEYPRTDQWFEVIGLQPCIAKALIERNSRLDELLMTAPDVLALTMKDVGAADQDTVLLNRGLGKLKAWIESQVNGGSGGSSGSISSVADSVLSTADEMRSTSSSPYVNWSAKSGPASQSSSASLTSRSTVSSTSSYSDVNVTVSSAGHASPISSPTPPPPPPPPLPTPSSAKARSTGSSSGSGGVAVSSSGSGGKFPTTPPPDRRNNIVPRSSSPLVKSISQELKHSLKTEHSRTFSSTDEEDRGVLPSEGSQNSGSLGRSIQRSPHMMHKISHRFETKKMISRCSYCKKHIFLHQKARLCVYCKYRCHKECEATVAMYSCGMPEQYLAIASQILAGGHGSLPSSGGPSLGNQSAVPLLQQHYALDASNTWASSPSFVAHAQADSTSAASSSSSSSNPNSPLLFQTTYGTSVSAQASPCTTIRTFSFSASQPHIDAGKMMAVHTTASDSMATDFISTTTSNDSDNTIISACSDKTLPDRTGSIDSQDPDHLPVIRQPSLTKALEEWDIPYSDLKIVKPIGTGRFGTVYSGEWHGPVAIKMLPVNSNEAFDDQLAAFKQEIAMLKKTRHENIVLFMGACMKPPLLAIVTSYVNGSTLFVLTRKERWNISRICTLASQTVQGMGYLHSKGIVHKDLTTKNIFLDRDRIIITDFGLSNVMRLAMLNDRGDGSLLIPRGWLCYLAAEIVCSLRAGDWRHRTPLPFTTKTDVYAFGTVFYEMLFGEWPFSGVEPEVIIWQVGRGIKQSLYLVQSSREVTMTKEVKDVLLRCWTYHADSRPTFAEVLLVLEKLTQKLPRQKRLVRSPSYPAPVTRSLDTVFRP